MAYEQYQTANGARGQLFAGISAGASTVILKDWRWDLFPAHNGTTDKDYLCTQVKYDVDWETVLKEEIVKVTARTGDTFTIERGAWTCPWSDTSIVQDNTAYAFDADDYFYLNVTAEIIKDFQAIYLEILNNLSFDSYDGIVDAWWMYGYLTVWEALADGKKRIFVKNWAYTETFWDCTAIDVQIIWESRLWVVITFDNSDAHSSTYIDASNWTWFLLENMSFVITFNNTNSNFIYTSTSFAWLKFKTNNCGFEHFQWVNPTLWNKRYYVNGTYLDATYSSTIVSIPRSFENWFFDCYFYTEYDYSSWEQSIQICKSWFWYFEWCRFETWTSAWTINLNGICILNKCFLDVFNYWGGGMCLHRTTISLKNGWWHWNSYNWPTADINFYTVNDSYIKYNTATVWTSTWIIVYYWMRNSQLEVLAQDIDIWGTWFRAVCSDNFISTTWIFLSSWANVITWNNITATTTTPHSAQNGVFTGNKVVWNFEADAWAFQVITWNEITWTAILWVIGYGSSDNSIFSGNQVWGTLAIYWRYASISSNGISWVVTFWAVALENAFTGNFCSTITVTAWSNYNVITGNQNGVITDSGTWTIKIWNRNN